MQKGRQKNQGQNILKSEDISQIIKYFSFTIQQRFEQLQKTSNYFTCLNSNSYQKSSIQTQILHKYSEYETSSEYQVKLLQKFVQRIIQIFQFFRQKYYQEELSISVTEVEKQKWMTQKITDKLKQIIKNQLNYHFFVNNRPKTHKTSIKPLGNNRTINNEQLAVIAPNRYSKQTINKENTKADIDVNAVFISNKKARTQQKQKRVVQVGKLFKYVFSILKRGYLTKLKMQKGENKNNKKDKNSQNQKDQNATISIEGTCAILRTYSEKSKQNTQDGQGGNNKILGFNKEKSNNSILNQEFLNFNNKKQLHLYRKIKNRSISTNNYSILSSHNPSTLKQTTSKIRQLQKKALMIYDILDIERYSLLRVAKDPQFWKKDQLKRNLVIQNQRKKYMYEFNSKTNLKDRTFEKLDEQSKQSQDIGEVNQNTSLTSPHQNYEAFQQQKVLLTNYQNENIEKQNTRCFQQNRQTQNQHRQNLKQPQNPTILCIGDQYQQQLQSLRIKNTYDIENIKTESNEYISQYSSLKQKQNQKESSSHTLVVRSSRPHKQDNRVLTDKISNLMDRSHLDQPCTYKSKSVKQSRKAIRLNLPNMLGDKSNIMNETNVQSQLNKVPNPQKNYKMSQKSQAYLQNYHLSQYDDSSFVPLLPLKQKNNENSIQKSKNSKNSENSNDLSALKRKNLMSNFHPLNRCRIFRERKNLKSNLLVPHSFHIETKISQFDPSIINRKIKNVIL